MSGMGYRRQEWTKELEDKLLAQIRSGKKMIALTVTLGMSVERIKDKLKEMGFNGIKDARKIMRD